MRSAQQALRLDRSHKKAHKLKGEIYLKWNDTSSAVNAYVEFIKAGGNIEWVPKEIRRKVKKKAKPYMK